MFIICYFFRLMWVFFVILQLDFYTQFAKAHPNCIVGLRAFEKLKPYYVRRLKECNTCACKYHIEMVELHACFNNMRTLWKEFMELCVCVIVMFAAMIVQAIMLLKECNFLVSLICGCHWCVPKRNLKSNIIHCAWEGSAHTMALICW